MTNINCSLNCIYQKDGKCNYNLIIPSNISSHFDCAYFIEKNNK
ncbi:MAG: hydroxymyristoyl-ACP dehydratase [Clostridia bacterium]|nr:hydroxymyristoyl-ACP dehydratase [Clostridium sp.]MBS6252224.1 hydroxymyristoyl-ACP dehydratase [Clostridium sp.]